MVFEKLQSIYRSVICWILNKPKTVVRIVVLSGCFVAVMFQLYECAVKLVWIPITTHSHFDLNETMYYPAITFCREPPYKKDVLESYNITVHPKYVGSNWEDFDFEEANLSQVFEEGTYSFDEFFVSNGGVGLNGMPENVEVSSTLNFNVGKCYTVKPIEEVNNSLGSFGYSIELLHSAKDFVIDSSLNPGWHVYIHEPDEKFSEEGMKKSGRVEYLYIETNEDLKLKITAQHFVQLNSYSSKCSEDDQGASICGEYCKWQKVTDKVGCTGPWMLVDMAMCNNSDDTLDLITAYTNTEIDEKNCGCFEPCNSVIYSAYVVDRKSYGQDEPRSLFRLHYSSKMVTFIEEVYSYGFSQFIADIGGSLGFLLGLSVIGLIAILEKLLKFLFMGKTCQKYKNEKLDISSDSIDAPKEKKNSFMMNRQTNDE